MNAPLTIRKWPSCILHLDADAFFASVEQTVNPKLKGKPVIVGAERGIVAAASYEAKRMGVKTGSKLTDARKLCPGLVCLPGDYETYSIFSKRMFSIMRRTTPAVEEYSIDEAFADLSGLRRVHRAPYSEIARRMKVEIERELGLTVSVGVSLTKGLAKLASKRNKPSGLVVVPGRRIHELLAGTALKQVWGFGPNTVAVLEKLGVTSALDFVRRPIEAYKRHLTKPGFDIYRELSGTVVSPVVPGEKTTYASISKVKTFTPPSKDRDFLVAQALRNLESACLKARRYHLKAAGLSLFLRRQDFQDYGTERDIPLPTSAILDLSGLLLEMFTELYRPGVLYRSTGVVLSGLEPDRAGLQLTLFEEPRHSLQRENASQAIDAINAKYGKHKIHLAASLGAQKRHEGARGELSARKKSLFKGETFRQRLGLAVFQPKVN